MTHVLPALPYAKDAFQPLLSSETFDYHYGKHHKAYVDKLNQLIVNTEFSNMSLEEIVQKATGPIFNNAAQVWNHTFFWNSLSPKKTKPSDILLKKINEKWHSLQAFEAAFQQAAIGQFGSGWAWLILQQDGSLNITTTSNAETPVTKGLTPLLTCDVWEHAYYIDFRNDRAKFVSQILSIINWDFASSNFAHTS